MDLLRKPSHGASGDGNVGVGMRVFCQLIGLGRAAAVTRSCRDGAHDASGARRSLTAQCPIAEAQWPGNGSG
eukprot:748492-Hanusia_phi.AAC.4